MVNQRLRVLILGILLIVASQLIAGCESVEVDSRATETAIAEMIFATLTGTAISGELVDAAGTIAYYETQGAGLTETAKALPTSTSTDHATASPTSLPPTITPTNADNPYIDPVIVLVNAACRSGPSTVYEITIYVSSGEGAFILGSNPAGDWYFIKTSSLDNCWIFESLVSPPVSGTPPVFTPPPTPINSLTPTIKPTVQDIGTPAP